MAGRLDQNDARRHAEIFLVDQRRIAVQGAVWKPRRRHEFRIGELLLGELRRCEHARQIRMGRETADVIRMFVRDENERSGPHRALHASKRIGVERIQIGAADFLAERGVDDDRRLRVHEAVGKHRHVAQSPAIARDDRGGGKFEQRDALHFNRRRSVPRGGARQAPDLAHVECELRVGRLVAFDDQPVVGGSRKTREDAHSGDEVANPGLHVDLPRYGKPAAMIYTWAGKTGFELYAARDLSVTNAQNRATMHSSTSWDAKRNETTDVGRRQRGRFLRPAPAGRGRGCDLSRAAQARGAIARTWLASVWTA